LTSERFAEFFSALKLNKDHTPFPWQRSLAQKVCSGAWPACIALPTASGKTACIDIAVFALACQADRAPGERTAPRRIFFVVDRRVIVDEAYERAEKLAKELAQATQGILKDVADALRRVARASPDAAPLDAYQLRGGIYRDDSWVRSPLQPTVVASTVDQVGSRLLFRGYGVSDSAKPIHAALIGNDSLIVLDEAHCAQPFRETLQSVAQYRGPAWTGIPLNLPLHVVEMSATPRDGANAFRLDAADLADPVLSARRRAAKPARLVVAAHARGTRTIPELAKSLEEVAEEIAAREPAPGSVAIIVNRVRTARLLSESLEKKHPGNARLIIGRMRPLDRKALTKEIQEQFGSGAKRDPTAGTRFVVATQCLEVGADFDFDAMVCECASLDALRQRFGRLNRLGRDIPAPAAVVVSAQDEAAKAPDPIYGEALAKTWAWLKGQSTDEVVDFGIDALDRLWQAACERDPELVDELQAPAPHAPVMLPAHLDCWCQTSPMPVPDPDVSLFLHGPEQGQPEVQVCWRADLDDISDPEKRKAAWTQAVILCPPVSAECLSVPLWLVRQWLTESAGDDDAYADVLGGRSPAPPESAAVRPGRGALLWRGPDGSLLVRDAADLRPGDTLVLPVEAGGWSRFGHIPDAPAEPEEGQAADASGLRRLDCGSQAFTDYHKKRILRLHPKLWGDDAALGELKAWAHDPEDNRPRSEIRALLARVADALAAADDGAGTELVVTLRALAESGNDLQMDRYHGGIGAVLRTRKRVGREDQLRADDGDDCTSLTERKGAVSLAEHLAGVARCAAHLTEGMGPLASAAALAAQCHDLGKADPRFQAYLRQCSLPDARIWAKHPNAPVSYEEHRQACRRSGRPEGWRHELLSVALLQSKLATDLPERDLVLHLIAVHHGHCRPFAPVVADPSPAEVRVGPDGSAPDDSPLGVLAASSATGLERLDSGVAERFWTLTRLYGWWGLPYLEACVRLADWQQSAEEALDGPLPDASPLDLGLVLAAPVRLPEPQAEFLLRGIDGANPLGFLAALGTLRVLTGAWPDRHVRLSWRQHAGAWRPVIHADGPVDAASLLVTVAQGLHTRFGDHPAVVARQLRAKGVSPLDAAGLRRLFRESTGTASGQGPATVEWLACLASDCGEDKPNQLQVVRRDYFLENLRNIVEGTTREHLRRTLLLPWDYADSLDNQSLHWDPSEDRRYALQWHQPSGDPTRRSGGMLGANRLAMEALPLHPIIVADGALVTVGFTGTTTTNTRWTWPIWDAPVPLAVIGSLLRHAALQDARPRLADLEPAGMVAACRSRRILVEKTPNLTPSEVLLP
jgi:CRISPR-associated endonuclease/helicase Cas3